MLVGPLIDNEKKSKHKIPINQYSTLSTLWKQIFEEEALIHGFTYTTIIYIQNHTKQNMTKAINRSHKNHWWYCIQAGAYSSMKTSKPILFLNTSICQHLWLCKSLKEMHRILPTSKDFYFFAFQELNKGITSILVSIWGKKNLRDLSSTDKLQSSYTWCIVYQQPKKC